MSEKFIVHVHDPEMTIGEAIKLLSRIDYDDTPFEPICAWRLSDGHCVCVDSARNKDSIRFDIWKEKE